MYIHAAARFVGSPVDDSRRLKEVLQQYTATPFRRVNRFILLALIGAHRCAQGRTLDARTAVYLTTENGNLGDTNTVLDQIFRQRSLPMPFSFINTMSNTAPFYVAQSLGVLGRNLSVSGRDLCFERGLELAGVDFDLRQVDEALIGAVDEGGAAEGAADAAVEGSCWLYLRRNREGALGEVDGIRSFPDREALASWWVDRPDPPDGRPMLACGATVPPEERDDWRRRTGWAVFDYLSDYGPFDTVTAYGIATFVESGPPTVLFHLNRDRQGRYVVLTVRRY